MRLLRPVLGGHEKSRGCGMRSNGYDDFSLYTWHPNHQKEIFRNENGVPTKFHTAQISVLFP